MELIKSPGTINHVRSCFLLSALSSRQQAAEQGVSLSTQWEFGKLHSGLPARPPLQATLLWCASGQAGWMWPGRLLGGPHHHSPSGPVVQIPLRRLRAFSFCRELAACYPRWSRAARKFLKVEVEGTEGAGTVCIAAFPCFRGLCACKPLDVWLTPFLIVQPGGLHEDPRLSLGHVSLLVRALSLV